MIAPVRSRVSSIWIVLTLLPFPAIGHHSTSEFDPAVLGARRIVTGRHCFGCTAGAGSSCGGQLE